MLPTGGWYPDTAMEFRQYLNFVRRWLWLILVLGLSFGAAGYFAGMTGPTLYESTVTVLVTPPRTADRQSPNYQDMVTNERRAITYSLLLTKRAVMEGIIEKLGLELDPGVLAGRIQAEFLRDTELINVTVRDTDPDQAALIANTIVSVFNAQEADLLANPYAATLPSLHAVEPARRGSLVPSDAPRNAILGFVVGMLAAVAFGIIWQHFDDRVRTAEDVEGAVGVTPLATIGRIGGMSPSSRMITLTKGTAPIAEAYRMFRAYLDQASGERPVRSLLVVSPASGDGKSTTAANLAIAVAQTSSRVILVDANLRQPTLHTLLKLENGRGLAQLLEPGDATPIGEYLAPTPVENLRLLRSGGPVDDTTRLLGGPRLAEALAALKEQADLVVIDSPQLLGIVDASLLIKEADATVLVVRSGVTRAPTLRTAYDYVTRTRASLLGVVLNCAARASETATSSGDGGGGRRQRLAAPAPRPQAPASSMGVAVSLNDGAERRQPAE